MRRALILLPVILAACATPREQCISEVSRELRVVNGLVTQTQQNISRGYALERVQDIRVVSTTCTGTNADGSTFTFPCEETETFNRSVPVAIDLDAERAKLESLLERQAQLQRATDAAIQQCVAAYPE